MNSKDRINNTLEEHLVKAEKEGERLGNPYISTIVSDTFGKVSEYMIGLPKFEEHSQGSSYMEIAVALDSMLFTIRTQHATSVQDLWDKEVKGITDNVLTQRIEGMRKAAHHIREASKAILEFAR